MDNTNQPGSQQPISGGVDVLGVEATMDPAPASVAPKKELESATVTEYIKPSEPALEIHPEIAGIGVEETSKHPTLTSKHHEAGIRLSEPKPMTADVPQPQPLPSLPISEDEAKHVAKIGKVDDTRSWLANLVLRVMGKIRDRNKKKAYESTII